MVRRNLAALLLAMMLPALGWAERPGAAPGSAPSNPSSQATPSPEEWNQRLAELVRNATATPGGMPSPQDYRIGPDDQLAITVLEAPDLTRTVKVSASGEVSLPMLGVVKAASLSTREMELVLQELLRRTYMKDPHVSVQVSEVRSHPVSVMGAVKKPGVYQMEGTRTLLEVLSMAEGLAPDAGDSVIVMRAQGGPHAAADRASSAAAVPEAIEIHLRKLLETPEPQYNVRVYPGDIVKVKQAGAIYVVGEFNKPGGYPLRSSDRVTVLQAVALGGGLTPTAAKGSSVIIHTGEDGQRTEVPVNLNKILRGKSPDIALQSNDILFVPNSKAKSAARGTVDALVRTFTLRTVIR